ncbi:hypothetical protein KA005_46835 [bacterium]|nr:hypothetical protein [bacterium]
MKRGDKVKYTYYSSGIVNGDIGEVLLVLEDVAYVAFERRGERRVRKTNLAYIKCPYCGKELT